MKQTVARAQMGVSCRDRFAPPSPPPAIICERTECDAWNVEKKNTSTYISTNADLSLYSLWEKKV